MCVPPQVYGVLWVKKHPAPMALQIVLSLDPTAKMILVASTANPTFFHQSILTLLEEQGIATTLKEGSYTHEIKGDELILSSL